MPRIISLTQVDQEALFFEFVQEIHDTLKTLSANNHYNEGLF